MFFQKANQIKALQTENEMLKQTVQQCGAGDALQVQNYLAQLNQNRTELEAYCNQLTQQRVELEHQQNNLKQQLQELQSVYTDATVMVDFGLTDYAHPAKNSTEIGLELEYVRTQIKEMIRNKTAAKATQNFTFNDSASRGRKFVADMSKMMLRAYNAEAENCVLTVKAGNGEAAKKRLERAREQVSKLGVMINLEITVNYHRLRLQELSLALQYQNTVKAEKEAEKERRAQLREERKAQQELEAERAKLGKEKSHYERIISTLREQGKDIEADEMEAKLEEINQQIESVDFRAANIRAGYVYVISNIGAFGNKMVKIGMTRRLDPMDRVRELSDASVPFNFDVHALFFSEDAVGIETQLHQQFAHKKVNLVNQRREFFEVSPLEVKEALLQIAQGALLEFVEEPEAAQYRESQAIRNQLHQQVLK